MDDELDPELPTGAIYAGRPPADAKAPKDARTWKAQTEADSDGKTAKFILYTGKEVRYNPMWQEGGDVIRVREFHLQNYRNNPVVLADHDMSKIIGRGTATIVDTGDDGFQLRGDVIWDIAEDNPLAVTIAGQHARKMRHAVSIGFMPGKGSQSRTKLDKEDPYWLDPEKVSAWRAGWVYRKPELYEWSSVGVPKDPGALQLQRWALEAETDEQRIARICTEIVTRQQAEWILQAVRHDPQVRAAIIAAAFSQTPAPAPAAPSPTPSPAPEPDWLDSWE